MPQESHEILDKNGYIIWDWNLDTQDWRATTDNIVSNVLYYARDKRNLVLCNSRKRTNCKCIRSNDKGIKGKRVYNNANNRKN